MLVTATEHGQAFERHRHEVYAWAYRLLGRHHDALDVAQDVFLRWVDQASDAAPAHPRAWLRRVTVNRAIDVLRERWPEGNAAALPDDAPAHFDWVEDHELRDAVVRGLRSLSDAQRSVLVAKIYDGLTFAEIASELDIAIPTAKTHYLRALAAMRGELAPQWAPERSES